MARLAWSRGATRLVRAMARLVGTPGPGVDWTLLAGPYFGNAVATLVHSGRSGHVTVEGTTSDGRLHPLAEMDLSAEMDLPGG
jgi:hypothetical protein